MTVVDMGDIMGLSHSNPLGVTRAEKDAFLDFAGGIDREG